MSEKKPSFSIKNWSEDDQPREKLLKKGKAALIPNAKKISKPEVSSIDIFPKFA